MTEISLIVTLNNQFNNNNVNTIFVESTYDDTWGSGLNFDGTINTKKDNWPGNNQLGKLLQIIASSCRPSTSEWRQTTTKKTKRKTKRTNMSEVIHGLKDTGKRDRTGRRKSYSEPASPTSSPSGTDMEEG